MRSINERRKERGVSIVLVAVCLVALLAMAALAIDVVTLYVAHAEAQRAADAAALAGARMIAGSGYTSAGPSWNGGDSTPLCQTSGPGAAAAANIAAEAIARANLIAGQPGAVLQIYCTMSPGNPWFKVVVQRTNLPTFFARIWGRTASTVTATSTAEAYNPSWSPNSPPVAVAVKPWLLPNCDSGHTAPQTRTAREPLTSFHRLTGVYRIMHRSLALSSLLGLLVRTQLLAGIIT